MPAAALSLQDLQDWSHSWSQQTPSVQNPLLHCESWPHDFPLARPGLERLSCCAGAPSVLWPVPAAGASWSAPSQASTHTVENRSPQIRNQAPVWSGYLNFPLYLRMGEYLSTVMCKPLMDKDLPNP